MKSFTAFILMSAFTANAFATNMNCVFTEPFVTLDIDTKEMLVKIDDANAEPAKSSARIGTINETKNHISITFGADNILLVDKRIKGDDGMSDNVYQATGHLKKVGEAGTLVQGGCNTKKK
jgi:hypothetical protein